MKLYKHSDGKKHWYPETIPQGWAVILKPDTFEVFWRKTKS